MAENRFKCVFFDWDLTLVRVLGNVSPEERLTALFQREGLPYTLREVQSAVRLYQEDVARGKIERPSTYQTQEDIARYYQDILARLNDMDPAWERVNRLYNAFANLPQLPFRETIPVLKALQAQGVKLGIISNHSRRIRPVAERVLAEVVPPEMIVISQEVGVHKPDREIFEYACAQAGETAADCMFVGNDLYVDAIGAVTEGGFGLGLWLDHLGAEVHTLTLPERVKRIHSLWQTLEFI